MNHLHALRSATTEKEKVGRGGRLAGAWREEDTGCGQPPAQEDTARHRMVPGVGSPQLRRTQHDTGWCPAWAAPSRIVG